MGGGGRCGTGLTRREGRGLRKKRKRERRASFVTLTYRPVRKKDIPRGKARLAQVGRQAGRLSPPPSERNRKTSSHGCTAKIGRAAGASFRVLRVEEGRWRVGRERVWACEFLPTKTGLIEQETEGCEAVRRDDSSGRGGRGEDAGKLLYIHMLSSNSYPVRPVYARHAPPSAHVCCRNGT